MPDARKYSDDEVREIIERALKPEAASASTISHGDLLAIGEQVGVTPEAMTRAAREVSEARLALTATQAVKSRRRKLLAFHSALFAIVNALLFTVNFLTTPGEWWFLFSVFFWGLALAAHAGIALGTGISARSLERERRRLAARQTTESNQKLRVEALPPETPESLESAAGSDHVQTAPKSPSAKSE